jgi:hypothetical protein
MRRLILCFFAFVLFAALAYATAPVAAQGILPNSFAGRSATAKSGLKQPVLPTPEGQAALVEYGFVSGEEAEFTQGPTSIHVRVYQMKDPTGGYGVYSYLRTPDLPRADLAEHSAMSRERALALAGNLVIEIRGSDLPKAAADLKALVAAVAAHAEEGPLPTLTQHLPLDDMVERSDHYVLGPQTLNQFFPLSASDWLGFSDGVEAETAKYRVHGKELTLLVADFPTPQAATKKLAELKQQYNVNGSQESAGAPLFAKRSVTLLAIVSGAGNPADADFLLKNVHSGTELTWNEPNFELTQPNIGTIVVGTIIGTGIICAFALISGFAFGGFRLIIKRLLPDKVFDRSSHLQVLQLGLSSKPIKAEDFYGLGPSARE